MKYCSPISLGPALDSNKLKDGISQCIRYLYFHLPTHREHSADHNILKLGNNLSNLRAFANM